MNSRLRIAIASLVSGLGTLGSAWAGLAAQGWTDQDKLVAALWPYGLGGALGGAAAGFAVRYLLGADSTGRRFALALAVHAVIGIGMTMLLFALQYRLYFAQWHSDAFTLTWVFQTVFTTIGSFYLFFSTGLVLLVPWAILCWIAMAAMLARPLMLSGAGATRSPTSPPAI